MNIKEYVTDVIEGLDEPELKDVADYLAFLRFRARSHSVPLPDDSTLAALYREFGEEDRVLAEEGMAGFDRSLRMEDAL